MNRKIGIAFLTYNRGENFIKQLKKVYENKTSNMFLLAVKDKNIEYPEPFEHMLDEYYNTPNGYIAFNKNIALIRMLQNGCTDLFLIEDDMNIKDMGVFDLYINTAKAFNIEHLNYIAEESGNPKQQITQRFVTQYKDKEYKLTCWFELNGCFQYFTANCIYKCGMYDERFYNIYEHSEHTLRIFKRGFTTGPGKYADVANSNNYLELITDIPSTINRDMPQKDKDKMLGHYIGLLEDIYGSKPWKFQSDESTEKFLNYKLSTRRND